VESPDLLIVGADRLEAWLPKGLRDCWAGTALSLKNEIIIPATLSIRRILQEARIQVYGPHYFRTNTKEIVDYLSEFTG